MRLNLARRYKRWRHGRGFGIHSPFAYDFITRTLRERLPYYAYTKLDALAAAQRLGASEQRRLRLIFRIAVRFNPPSAAIIGNRNDSLQKVALKSVRRDINLNADVPEADLIIVNDDSSRSLTLRDKAVCIFPDTNIGGQKTCEDIWAATTSGMRFDNSRGFTIIVKSPHLPHQHFDV
ncbi:MAG: hypothetical protein K2J10_05650, partial [Muribaculaceae bacterium]|nr:hypothetical protein [Muribaculaceae bacterium]